MHSSCTIIIEWKLKVANDAESLDSGRKPPNDLLKRYYLFLDREKRREKERERTIDVREKHQLVASGACPDGD